jgi:hypothetical protein
LASEGLHEPAELLGEATIDRHRAYVSLREELEAIDSYDQRIQATEDASLAAVLTNSRDDEKEHASMTLEWLRRHDAPLDEQLRRFLFTTGPLHVPAELQPDPADEPSPADVSSAPDDGSLRIGSLKGRA